MYFPNLMTPSLDSLPLHVSSLHFLVIIYSSYAAASHALVFILKIGM